MNHEERCQPLTPVPSVHTSAHQQTSCSQPFGPERTERTQTASSVPMSSAQTPQPPQGAFPYYQQTVNYMQHFCMPPLPGGPIQLLHEEAQNLPSMAITSTQIPHTVPSNPLYNWETLSNSMPSLPASAGDMTACQLHKPSPSLLQGVPGGKAHSSKKPAEDALQKRELRLMKNREAARECRRKKKEYVKCLENRVAVLENQNKTLIEELRALKDIYRHKVEEAARESRRRKKEYMDHLQTHVALLQRENQILKAQLQDLSNLKSE